MSLFQLGGLRGITWPDPGLEAPGLARGTRRRFSILPGLPRPATSQEFTNNFLVLVSKLLMRTRLFLTAEVTDGTTHQAGQLEKSPSALLTQAADTKLVLALHGEGKSKHRL